MFNFADDCKVVKSIGSTDDCISLQHDLDKLVGWANKWKMEFNSKKCCTINFGNQNDSFAYDIEGDWLEAKENERDLGVIIDSKLKFKEQCIAARNRANRVLGFIKRNVSYKSKFVIMSLYNSYVRPHLEYCVQAWKPHYRHDINMLESVQRRATKLIPELKSKSYSERLKALDMFSLEYRLLRGDLIEVFKIINGIDKINYKDMFVLRNNDRTRGHNLTLQKPSCNLDVRKYSFSNRVVAEWNALPNIVAESESLDIFKKMLDSYLENRYR